jgi:hypothetical protein
MQRKEEDHRTVNAAYLKESTGTPVVAAVLLQPSVQPARREQDWTEGYPHMAQFTGGA